MFLKHTKQKLKTFKQEDEILWKTVELTKMHHYGTCQTLLASKPGPEVEQEQSSRIRRQESTLSQERKTKSVTKVSVIQLP